MLNYFSENHYYFLLDKERKLISSALKMIVAQLDVFSVNLFNRKFVTFITDYFVHSFYIKLFLPVKSNERLICLKFLYFFFI